MIEKLLIANRGEIATRIMRTCRERGIATVAVYSDADRASLHVLYADEAHYLGGNAANESYLNADKIISLAKKCGAQAIHPGYGFLAENGDFCQACRDAGLIFVGPEPFAITAMGSKTQARQLMQKAGVPLIPGTVEPLPEEPQKACHIAEEIGFPIMIKASAGGGGKGMRIVRSKEEFQSALRTAKSEARSSFANDEVYLERYIENPHHIEIQIFGDSQGNFVHLFERECSIQRRHQKVIEESPSPFITPELRQQMGETAIAAARAVGYRNAGTVEFIVDAERRFYFLEMNTRLQVEHPVTELVTGKDLVALQLDVAMGKPIPFSQEELEIRGAALECRIYAEDPDNNFIPSPGKIVSMQAPSGPGIRNDEGVYPGAEISLFYDPMISKLCTWGENRAEAIQRMKRALSEYRICGIKSNIPLHQKILSHPQFVQGDYTTSFIPQFISGLTQPRPMNEMAVAAAAIYTLFEKEKAGMANVMKDHRRTSNWKEFGKRRTFSLRSRLF